MIEGQINNDVKAKVGLTFHRTFVSKDASITWVIVITVRWPAAGEKAFSKHTTFDVDLEVKHQKTEFCSSFTDVPLVDAVENEID